MTKPKQFFVPAGYDGNYATLLSSRNDESTTDTYDYPNYEDYENKEEKAYESFIKQAIKLLNKSISDEKLSVTARSIIEFEKKLSNVSSYLTGRSENEHGIYRIYKIVLD